MNNYFVGQKVIVVDAQEGIYKMAKMIGKVCTIAKVMSGCYLLEEDQQTYAWLARWLKPYEEETEILTVTESELEALINA